MKVLIKTIFVLMMLSVSTLAKSQVATSGSSQFSVSVKGDYQAIIEVKGRDGSNNLHIACACSEAECYNITVGTEGVIQDGGEVECGGQGINEGMAAGTSIQLQVGSKTYVGELLEYTNQSTGQSLLDREHIFTLKNMEIR